MAALRSGVGFSFIGLTENEIDEWTDILDMPNPGSLWSPALAGLRFLINPSRHTLSHELAQLHAIGWKNPSPLRRVDPFPWSMIPWPLALCLAFPSESDSLIEVSKKAAAGEFGDIDEWRECEKKWMTEGVSIDEIVSCSQRPGASFSRPWSSFELFRIGNGPQAGPVAPYASALIESLSKIPASGSRQFASSLILRSLAYMDKRSLEHDADRLPELPTPEEYSRWIIDSELGYHSIFPSIHALPFTNVISSDWAHALNDLGILHPNLYQVPFYRHTRPISMNRNLLCSFLVRCINQDSSRHGLLPWIAGYVLRGVAMDAVELSVEEALALTDGNLFVAAVVILCAQGGVSKEGAAMLAARAIDFIIEEGSAFGLFQSVFCLDRHLNQDWSIRYVVTLLRGLASCRYYALETRCVEWLSECLANRLSPLHQTDSIKNLGLSHIMAP